MVSGEKDCFTLVAVGDVSPNRDDPPSIFRYCGDAFRTADIVFGQMEVPLSSGGTPMFSYHTPCRLAPRNVSALTDAGAGFDIVSFASNHAMDYGWEAFCDTLDALKKNNIPVIGAGRNIQEARQPVILERKGTRVGFLGYLSIIVPGLTAYEDVPGCAPLRASTAYQQVDVRPGAPPLVLTTLWPEDKKTMEDDIRRLRPQVDILVVSIHAGVSGVPAVVGMYQKEAAYAAIDAGADLVLQHHAHILKGIEVNRGKAVFYGTNHFAIEHHLPFPGRMKTWDAAGTKVKKQLYRMKVVPGWEKHPFHEDARKTIMAKAYIQAKKIAKVTYLPAWVNLNMEPEVLTRRDPRAQEVFDYVRAISEAEDLNVQFSWDGDEVLVSQ